MAFIAAKCPACGGEIQLDDSKESGFCMYCGSRVLLEQAIPQKVEIDGLATLEVKLKNAEAYSNLGKYKEAYNTYRRLTEEFTNDYRAWWGCAKTNAEYSNFYSEYVYVDTIKECDDMRSALKIANNTQRKIIEQEYAAYRERIRQTNEHTASTIANVKETKDYSCFNHSSTKSTSQWSKTSRIIESIEGYEIIDGQLYEFEPQTLGKDDYSYRYTGKFHFDRVVNIVDHRFITASTSKAFAPFEQIVAISDTAFVIAFIMGTANGEKVVYGERVYNKSLVTPSEISDSVQAFKEGYNPDKEPDFSNGGCYIATAVYGSYDAPQVMVLRSFRDNTLAHSAFGRLFIKVYYKFSPPIADRLKGAKRTNAFIRRILDVWVEKLENKQADA